MPKSTVKTTSLSTTYYTGLVVQRVSLLFAVASTIILWATLISIAHGFMFTNSIKDVNLINVGDLNSGIAHEINMLTNYAVFFSLLAVAATLSLLKLTQMRMYEKKLVVDGLVIAGFCLIFAAACQPILRFILASVTS